MVQLRTITSTEYLTRHQRHWGICLVCGVYSPIAPGWSLEQCYSCERHEVVSLEEALHLGAIDIAISEDN